MEYKEYDTPHFTLIFQKQKCGSDMSCGNTFLIFCHFPPFLFYYRLKNQFNRRLRTVNKKLYFDCSRKYFHQL